MDDQSPNHEKLAQELEATGNYRVLRRLGPHQHIEPPDGVDLKRGIFFDVETTGLDVVHSEIIELAMVPFEFASDGRIFRVGEAYQQFNEPSEPIHPEITALTGITDAQVAGHKLDVNRIEAFAKDVALMIAHNAAFDRPFAERVSPLFKAKPWACSMSGISWMDEEINNRRLIDLLASFEFFFDNHRAVDDCLAAIQLLTMRLPKSGQLAMDALLQKARQTTYKIIAEGTPFELKDVLKRRGYLWNGDAARGPRAWWIEVSEENLDVELDFLKREIFQRDVDIPARKITAFDRFSGTI